MSAWKGVGDEWHHDDRFEWRFAFDIRRGVYVIAMKSLKGPGEIVRGQSHRDETPVQLYRRARAELVDYLLPPFPMDPNAPMAAEAVA